MSGSDRTSAKAPGQRSACPEWSQRGRGEERRPAARVRPQGGHRDTPHRREWRGQQSLSVFLQTLSAPRAAAGVFKTQHPRDSPGAEDTEAPKGFGVGLPSSPHTPAPTPAVRTQFWVRGPRRHTRQGRAALQA